MELVPLTNCFLYADDVVPLSGKAQMPKLLKICEDYSFSLGFHWDPFTCGELSDVNDDLNYELYGQTSLKQHPFSYLGIPFKPGGSLKSTRSDRTQRSQGIRYDERTDLCGCQP